MCREIVDDDRGGAATRKYVHLNASEFNTPMGLHYADFCGLKKEFRTQALYASQLHRFKISADRGVPCWFRSE